MQKPFDENDFMVCGTGPSRNFQIQRDFSDFETTNGSANEALRFISDVCTNGAIRVIVPDTFLGPHEWELSMITMLLDLGQIKIKDDLKIYCFNTSNGCGLEEISIYVPARKREFKISESYNMGYSLLFCKKAYVTCDIVYCYTLSTHKKIDTFCQEYFAQNRPVPHKDDPVRYVEKKKLLSVAMGLHTRLGAESKIKMLNADIIKIILSMSGTIGSVEFEAMRRGIILPKIDAQ
jgi:cupin superfamily acireductone dioxygenase involved in methionine salvage